MKWQPIETAPKDRDILLFSSGSKEQFVCLFQDGAWVYATAKNGPTFELKDASHWHELPKPPKSALSEKAQK